MVKKLQKSSSKQQADAGGTSPLASAVKDSAQQIWQVWVLFPKPSKREAKHLDSLVKEGLDRSARKPRLWPVPASPMPPAA